ncbi:hypothetical protein LG325_10410 [Marinobacter nauticus]
MASRIYTIQPEQIARQVEAQHLFLPEVVDVNGFHSAAFDNTTGVERGILAKNALASNKYGGVSGQSIQLPQLFRGQSFRQAAFGEGTVVATSLNRLGLICLRTFHDFPQNAHVTKLNRAVRKVQYQPDIEEAGFIPSLPYSPALH